MTMNAGLMDSVNEDEHAGRLPSLAAQPPGLMPSRKRAPVDRDAIPGDAYADDRTLPDATDPATGESADDALEATRTSPEEQMPAEDASPLPVAWSTHATQDSTQEAEWEMPYRPPENNATGGDDEDILASEGSSDMGVDRVVDASYFAHEADDVNDDDDAPLRRIARRLPDGSRHGS